MTLEEELIKLTPLADIMACEQTTEALRADARQEALIAAWRALEAGKPPGLVRADMRRAAINVDRGRSMTGSKRKPGIHGVDTHQRYGGPLYRPGLDGEDRLVVDYPSCSAEDEALALIDVMDRLAAEAA